MTKQLKKYNSEFKLKVVLKYLKEENTASQICQEFSVSKAALHKWVKQFKDNSSLIFNESSLSKAGNKEKKLAEKEMTKLYSTIGKLTVERDFLKKVLDT